MYLIALSLCVASLAFFSFSLIISKINHEHIFKDKYDFRNYFPYEINFELKFNENIYGNVLLVLAAVWYIASLVFSYISLSSGLVFAALFAGLFATIFMVSLFFTPLKSLKQHVLNSTLYMVFSFGFSLCVGIASFNRFQASLSILYLILAIIAWLIAALELVVIFNPKLSLNIKMKVIKNEDGTETYARPKYIIMALSEWLLILANYISLILLILFIK